MDRNQAKQLLPIIQAYAEGKAIESRCIKGDTSLWYDDEDPSFDDDFEYRIKPELKYRPFKDAEECWQEMKNHQPFGWVKCKVTGNKYLVSCIESDYSIFIVGDVENRTLRGFYTNFTFADGTPFGIKEGTDD